MEKEVKYSRKEFDGYTHRFKVEFILEDSFGDRRNIDIYSNCDSYYKLKYFIDQKKDEKVISFNIIHRASKEQDDAGSKFIEEFLNSLSNE